MVACRSHTHTRILRSDQRERNISRTSTGLIPTSIITAPGFIQLPFTIFGCPTAEMIISACRVISSGFMVREWTILTVASSLYQQKRIEKTTSEEHKKKAIREHDRLVQRDRIFTCSSRAAGIPTMLLLPITTALFPFI